MLGFKYITDCSWALGYDYEGKVVEESEDVLTRAVEVSHSRGSLRTPAYAVNVLDVDRKLLNEGDLLGVAEIHTVFRPKQLKNSSRNMCFNKNSNTV